VESLEVVMSESGAPEPAYNIPLDPEEKQLVGELVAIQGQIEYILGHIVAMLTGVGHEAMLAIMQSPSLKVNTHIFITVVRSKCTDARLLEIAEDVFDRMEDLSKGRNDFIHALFASDAGGTAFTLIQSGWGISAYPPKPVAVKTGSYRKRDVDELQAVRDEAAKISCALAHIERCLQMGHPGDASTPWLDRF
jgi:hypothetical protein